jgi:hypothetical protein
MARRLEKPAGHASRLHPEASVHNDVHTHTHNKDVCRNVHVPLSNTADIARFVKVLGETQVTRASGFAAVALFLGALDEKFVNGC